ncbi:MAG TPA: DUF2207 domain-containing protein [Woeseiaceae bacterium]|nr:DUF2207 domain-containing protein [Woeseiaceae bacterium]
MTRFLPVWLVLLPCVVAADERILDYHSDIRVREDAWIEVTETIKVRAEGQQIRRGIYRDYPTRYTDRVGNDVQVDYVPLSVLRDGMPEDFHSESRANGVRTYFGSADRLLNPGEYTYTYRYDAGRMLGYFESHDELYWNVTGLGWDFPIDRASATVSFDFELPSGTPGVDAYTGAFGATGKSYEAHIDAMGRAYFSSTRALAPGEGLTIAVNWPKGFVQEPGLTQRTGWLLVDNANLLVAVAGLLALIAYYIPVWHHFGRDPEKGVIVTRYEPPQGLSPASLRYISKMSYDNKAMTAAVVNLAVKGYLRIEEDGEEYTLRRLESSGSRPALAPGEKSLLAGLFYGGSTVVLDNKNHEVLGRARSLHRTSLKRDYANRYFRTNGGMNLPALLIALVAAIVATHTGSGPTPLVAVIVGVMIVVIVVFAILMKQPTGLGRKLLDEMDGFKEYLEIAEKDELNLRNPPEKTPALFERYLPFALALGVEQNWSERFARILAELRAPDGSPYHPAWYHGSWNNLNSGLSASSLASSLGGAISSSVSAPGSSSGSGGGGSSGGGGGGGGGGGW